MKRTSMLWFLLASLAVAPALADSQPSPEQRQAILAYKLTKPLADKLIAALPEMTRYVVTKPNFKEIVASRRSSHPASGLRKWRRTREPWRS